MKLQISLPQLLTISALIARQVSYALPLPQEQFADCSATFSGELIPDENIEGLFWGWENEKSCKKFKQSEPVQQQPIPEPGPADVHTKLLALINSARESQGQGAGPLKVNDALNRAAQVHTEKQAAAKHMTHQLPGELDLAGRLAEVHYNLNGAENVAFGGTVVEEIFNQWMGSDGHRKNILNPIYTEIGLGTATASDGSTYYTTVFGVPA